METNKTVLLVGGPESGKTNFLGKLWLTIKQEDGMLLADGIPKDLHYLNNIASYYNQGKFAPHTSSDVKNKVSISIKNSTKVYTDFKSTLIFPDVSGEEWENIYHKRGWSDDWEQTMASVVACLFFIRVDSPLNISGIDWLSWSHIIKDTPQKKYELPTQVVFIDWMQFLISTFMEKKSLSNIRFAIIVSAYDLLPEDQKELGPTKYLKDNFPMIWQYIESMDKSVKINVFGTSIASGDFIKDQTFRDNFLKDPNKAGYVIYESEGKIKQENDLSLPIVWSLGIKLTNI